MSTLLAFSLGTLLGALMAWPKAPRAFNYLIAPLLTLSAVPYYLLGLILVYLFSIEQRLFPLSGGYTTGTIPTLSLRSSLDVLHHALLPALSIVLAAIGFWALGMRGMMVTTEGEDYMILAEAKGLPDRWIFFRYALRNAILPQFTSLAIALGHVVSGSVLVEVVFGLPGIGTLLYKAITGSDLLRHLRHRVHHHPRDRPGDADHRPGLPAARSAHHVSEYVTMAVMIAAPRRSAAPARSGRTAVQSIAGLLPPQPGPGRRPGPDRGADADRPRSVRSSSTSTTRSRPRRSPTSHRPRICRSAPTTRAATCSRCSSPACR